MALDRRNIILTVDRSAGTAVASGDSVFIRDSAVGVSLVNVEQDDIDAGLVLCAYDCEEKLSETATGFTVDANGNVLCTLSTNTLPFTKLFGDGCEPNEYRRVYIKAFTTDPQCPIFNTSIKVYNFTSEDGDAPVGLASAADAIDEIEADLDAMQAEIDAIPALIASLIAAHTHDGTTSSQLDHSALANIGTKTHEELEIDLAAAQSDIDTLDGEAVKQSDEGYTITAPDGGALREISEDMTGDELMRAIPTLVADLRAKGVI